MKKTYTTIGITAILILASLQAFPQKAFYFGSDAAVNLEDSVVIRLNNYVGDIQWQKTYELDNTNNWENIPGATLDTLLFAADTTTYFRAKVIAGDCDPFYSDTTKVDVYTLKEEVALIDEDEMILVSDSTELEAGIYRFQGQTDTTIEPGNVILGQQGEGFMRRVLSIQQDGEELVLTTEQANMEDVFESFLLQDSLVITLDQSKTFIYGGRPLPLEVIYLPPGARLKEKGSGIDFSGTVIFSGEITDDDGNTASIEVGIEEGSVGFEPLIEREFDYRRFVGIPTRLNRMYLKAGGEIDANMSIYVQADAEIDYAHKILLASFQAPVPAGPVPMTVRLNFYLGFNTYMEAELYATAGFTSNYQVAFGAEYNRGADPQWEQIWERDAEFNPTDPTFSFYGLLTAKGYIEPEIAMRITGMAGPYFSVDPYLRFLGELNYPEWYWEIAAGIGGTLGFQVGLFGYEVLDYNMELFVWDNILASDTSDIESETEVVDVLNPATGKTWMDRNLGASRAATSSTDEEAYGDLYQWGRAADGHQVRTSSITATLSNSDTPGHGGFIITPDSPWDWRSPQNDNLWQGVNGTNNPCPAGYRLPTEAELNAERLSWSSNNAAGAFASPLKLPVAGFRRGSSGSLFGVGSFGDYWSSAVSGSLSRGLLFDSSHAYLYSSRRATGFSVRCLKDSETMTYTLVLEVSPEDGGQVSGAGEYTEGTTVTITATPNENYQFVNWTGDTDYIADASAPSTTLTMPAQNITLTANFEEDGGDNGDDTEVVDVLNPATGKTWMDRNLGATRAATSSTDAEAYGDLYQWGRAADGHQKRTSGTTSTLSNSDTPGHGNFITVNSSPYDWRSPQNDNLWQGVNGTNNPCPAGYRLPTEAELNAERLSWSSNDAAGAFASPLKLPLAGGRYFSNGSLFNVGSSGYYWSSTVDGPDSRYLGFNSSFASMGSLSRADGFSVRCLKD